MSIPDQKIVTLRLDQMEHGALTMLDHAKDAESQVADAALNADAALALCAAIRAGVKSVSASIVVLIDEL